MIELEHSPLGGSGAKRWLNCSGSFLMHREQLEDGVFERFTSEFADRGTDAHELAAECLNTKTEPYQHIGKEYTHGFIAGWPEGIELDAVSVYVDFCRSLLDKHLSADKSDAMKVRQMIEVTMQSPQVHELLKGTVDYGVWSPTLGVDVVDYKNGEGIGVDVRDNEQVKYYAFLLVLNHLQDWPSDTIMRLWIVQPNYFGIFEAPYSWETTIGAISDWGRNILVPKMDGLTRSRDISEDDFVLGEWCQFCPVLLDCPKTQRAFETYAQMADEEFVMMMSDEEISRYYEMRDPAMKFKNELEKVVYARKITGAQISSAKLVPKQIARQWKPGAEAAAKAQFGLKAMVPAKIKSPAALEKLSTDAADFAKEWGFKPNDGALTIAPLSDPRAEVSGKSARIFEKFATADTSVSAEDF